MASLTTATETLDQKRLLKVLIKQRASLPGGEGGFATAVES